jgi:rhodanese-related sulfurtransferase
MKLFFVFIISLFVFKGYTQTSISEILEQQNSHNVPYISVQELSMPKTQVKILDAREKNEFETSHLKNALHVGYHSFELDSVIKFINDKKSKIVVYCSVGIRSEKIASKIKKAGFTNVYNLYGGIFEWKNKGFPIYNSKNIKTDSIHTYSKKWSKWVNFGTKVF